MKVGDHVRLSDDAAAHMAKRRNWRSTAKVNWAVRTGTVVIRQQFGEHMIGVLWDGRSSIDYWREQLLVVVEEP